MILTLCIRKELWPVIVVLHVGDRAAEVDLLAVLAILNGVGADIWRHSDDITRVLLAPEVLLDLDEVSLMVIGGPVVSLFNLALVLEAFLISGLDLSLTVFFACQTADRWFVRVGDCIVGRLHEEDLVDGGALLDGVRADIGRVDHDLFHFAIGVQPRYIKNGGLGEYGWQT